MDGARAELEATKAAFEALEPLDSEQVARALRWIGDVRGVSSQISRGVESSSMPALPGSPNRFTDENSLPSTGEDRTISAEDFIAAKKPKGSAEKIACLGYYLSEYRGMRYFKTNDIVDLNTEAAQDKIGNPAGDVDNADRGSGYSTSAGDRRKQVSARGKALVKALPDRNAVKAALADHPVRRRKAAKKAVGLNGPSGSPESKVSGNDVEQSATSADGLIDP